MCIRDSGDRDGLLGTGVLVPSGDVQDAVGVDVERDLDLRLATRRRPDVLQAEPAQYPVVGRLLPLTLQHDDVHCGLVVLRRREDLRAPYRDCLLYTSPSPRDS